MDERVRAAVSPEESHTPEEERAIREYQNAPVDKGLVEFAQKAKSTSNDEANRMNYLLRETSEREVADIKKPSAWTNGYTHHIKGNTFRHVERRHGARGEHDISMSDLKDIGKIGWALDNCDTVEQLLHEKGKRKGQPVFSGEFRNVDHSPAPMVKYTKRIDGTMYVVEAAPDTKRETLQIVSAYIDRSASTDKNKNRSPESAQMASLPPSHTPEAVLSATSVPTARSPESALMASLPPSVTPEASVSATSVPTDRSPESVIDGNTTTQQLLSATSVSADSITESEENINGNNRNFERTPVIGKKSEEAGGEKTAAVREKGQETAEQLQGVAGQPERKQRRLVKRMKKDEELSERIKDWLDENPDVSNYEVRHNEEVAKEAERGVEEGYSSDRFMTVDSKRADMTDVEGYSSKNMPRSWWE